MDREKKSHRFCASRESVPGASATPRRENSSPSLFSLLTLFSSVSFCSCAAGSAACATGTVARTSKAARIEPIDRAALLFDKNPHSARPGEVTNPGRKMVRGSAGNRAGAPESLSEWIVLAFLVVAWMLVLFCSGCQRGIGGNLLIAPTPHTIFSTPTTIPSVTPSVNATTQPARDAAIHASNGKQLTAGLTQENLSQLLPQILGAWDQVSQDISRFTAAAQQAVADAIANDRAVAARNQELADARNIALQREQQLADAAKRQAILQKQIDDLKSGEAAKDRAAARKICVAAIGGGGLIFIVGVILFIYVSPKQAGLFVCLGGALAAGLGFTGLYHGEWIADIGIALLGVAVLGAIGAAIYFLRQDGMSIAEGVQHAATAGVIDISKAAPYFSVAQTAGAAKLVNQIKPNAAQGNSAGGKP